MTAGTAILSERRSRCAYFESAAPGGTPPASPRTALAAASDLCAVDRDRGVYYYLGDTPDGTTLVGIDTATGAELCSRAVPQLKSSD